MIEDFKNIDLIDKGCVVFYFLLLNCFDSKLLLGLTMLGQIYDTKAAISQLLLERVDLFNVSLG